MKKILIVEDDPSYRAELCQMLKFERYQVIRVEQGVISLELALEQHPDLILCNAKATSLDVFLLLGRLRSSSATSKVPFVFFAGRTDIGSHTRAMELGASSYLSVMASSSH